MLFYLKLSVYLRVLCISVLKKHTYVLRNNIFFQHRDTEVQSFTENYPGLRGNTIQRNTIAT